MRFAALPALLLLAACGDDDVIGEDRGVTANQIARLSTPEEETPDPRRPVRLEPLGLADLDAAGMPDPACDFSRDGRLLLAASSNDAIARIGGRLLHLTHSSPMEPSGGFFEDRQISISVGRAGESARLAVTNRRADARLEAVGLWRCGSFGGEEE